MSDSATLALPPYQREYTITLAYHLREFLIFALDRWTEQGLNRSEAVSIRAALLSEEGHEPLFDALKREIMRLKAELYDQKAGIRLVQDSCLSAQSAAEADTARLDWLEQFGTFATRASIDRMMKDAPAGEVP